MAKPVHLLAGMLAALALTACGGHTTGTPTANRDTVSVSGEGSVKARPDIFSLVAVARERGEDIAAMKSTVDDQVQAMLDLADDLGIEEKHVTARDIQISPEWQYQPERELIGHQVSREVAFQVSGMERYAELAEGLAQLGLKEIRPNGSEISNVDELAGQALEKAVHDARARAEILARAAGRELGAAISINARGSNVPRPQMMRVAMATQDSSESYRPGEQDVTASVQITFQLN